MDDNVNQRELYAAFADIKARQIPEILSRREWTFMTRLDLLAAALPTDLKETARGDYRKLLLSGKEPAQACDAQFELMKRLGLFSSPMNALDDMPAYTVALACSFILASPYISKDDDALYIHDNPVRKEIVFRVPCMPASGWKGSLRAADGDALIEALEQQIDGLPANDNPKLRACLEALWQRRLQRIRIFGNENAAWAKHLEKVIHSKLKERGIDQARINTDALDQDFAGYLKRLGYAAERSEGFAGGLYCFPTYFSEMGLTVINPRDRVRRTGTQPIYFECVPQGAEGEFAFLYVPRSLPMEGKMRNAGSGRKTADERQLAGDLELLGKAMHAMLRVKGFGAKTSAGFGAAENRLAAKGRLRIKIPDIQNGAAQETSSGDKTCIIQASFTSVDDLRAGFTALADSLRKRTAT